jgi:hypothetical protein
MVNKSELRVNVRSEEQVKDADRLEPKGTVGGTGVESSPVADTTPHRRMKQDLTRPGTWTKRGKPVPLPKG